MIDPALIPLAALSRLLRRETSQLRTGCYHQLTPSTGLSTDATLGWNTIRVMPVVVPNRCSLSKIGIEVTVAGATSSVFRLGIWNNDGSLGMFPGTLLLDVGEVGGVGASLIDGTTVAVAEKTISLAIKPGVYWVGGAVQGGTSGTQPTIRTVTGVVAGRGMLTNGTTPAAAQALAPGFSYGGVNGAFPSAWTGTVSPTSTCARIFAKIA